MAIAASPVVKPKRFPWRAIVFKVVNVLAVLMFMVLFGGGVTLLEPWGIALPTPTRPGYTPEIHRWHQAEWPAQMGILLGGSLIALLWRPRTKPLLVQFLLLGGIIFELFVAPFSWQSMGPFVVAPLLIIGLVVAAYPGPRRLLAIFGEHPISWPLLALSILAAVLLMPISWQAMQLQLTVADEHALHHHWVSAVVLALLLVLGGLLTATKRPGWKTLGVLTGSAFLYLGLAALYVPNNPGSWGISGGLLSVAGGIAFLVALHWEARKPIPTAESRSDAVGS